MRRDGCWRMKTWQCERLHARRPVVPNRALIVRASSTRQPHVVQFNKHDKDSVTKSLKTISAALGNDPLTRYLASNRDDETARRRGVTEYAQGVLGSASSAELLFQVSDFGGALFSHRVPQELVVPPAGKQPTDGEVQDDRSAKLSLTFSKLKRQFLQDHGSFIYISLMGVRPDMQRKGLGGLLLKTICRAADDEKKWCYLEATQAGMTLYLKHGFVVMYTSQLGPEAPVVQHMGRPPRAQ